MRRAPDSFDAATRRDPRMQQFARQVAQVRALVRRVRRKAVARIRGLRRRHVPVLRLPRLPVLRLPRSRPRPVTVPALTRAGPAAQPVKIGAP